MGAKEGSDRRSQEQGPLRRAAETVVDVTIGGAAAAADKGFETWDRLAQRGGEALDEGRRAARETASEVASTARETALDSDGRRYEDRTRDELYELAVERDIEGRSSMNKKQLISALRGQR